MKFYACLVENKVSKQSRIGEKQKKKHTNSQKKATRKDKGNRGRNAVGGVRKKIAGVIEVSIYKWTQCPIFYITLRSEKKLPIRKNTAREGKSYITCVCMSVL